ncbi:hypothetical protein LZ31DRAFT_83849 [Colletotrichum somersetense]|nr:hypothetical protein LZ31DRAFT_83849 [Colletotrichum somersetense]
MLVSTGLAPFSMAFCVPPSAAFPSRVAPPFVDTPTDNTCTTCDQIDEQGSTKNLHRQGLSIHALFKQSRTLLKCPTAFE